MNTNPQVKLNTFLVCGLGNLGQRCVMSLKKFGVKIIGIELFPPKYWGVVNLPEFLDELIQGDCCQKVILEKASINECRAALITTGCEQINIETALTIRQLNPLTRIVIRSSKDNLNDLLNQHLGNFIAYEPTQLPASTFALAALNSDILGLFNLDGQNLQVKVERINSRHPWCNGYMLYQLNNPYRRILSHYRRDGRFLLGEYLMAYNRQHNPLKESFYQSHPEEFVLPGDTVVYIEKIDPSAFSHYLQSTGKRQGGFGIKDKIIHFWNNIKKFSYKKVLLENHLRRIAIFFSLVVLFLLAIGTFFFTKFDPEGNLISAFYITVILLLGGYGDLFTDFESREVFPWWLKLFALFLNLAGMVFVGVLYALLIETLLSYNYSFFKKRPPIPKKDHIIIVGLGRVGQQVATILTQWQQLCVGITLNPNFDRNFLPEMPLIIGDLSESLAKANAANAKSIVILTDEEIVNLEVALTARRINPHIHVVIRTLGETCKENLTQLLTNVRVLGAYTVASEVFAGAAFGENIIDIFRLNKETILVTEYQIEEGDTLNGFNLSQIAYGYGVVPILHHKHLYASSFMPSEDIILNLGERLVLLATIDGLKRIEIGSMYSPSWRLQVMDCPNSTAAFEGANLISRVTGSPLYEAREFFNSLPGIFPHYLYQHQGLRLVRELDHLMIKANLFDS